MTTSLTILVGIVLTIAVVTDLGSQRIPNWLTFSAALAAITHHTLTGGTDGLFFALSGLGLGLAVMLPPYLFGFMGGGDVKLMGAMGAFLGTQDIFIAFVLTSIAGGAYALFVLLFRLPLLRSILGNVRTSLWLFAATRKMDYAPTTAQTGGANGTVRENDGSATPKLCYGVAIAAGTVGAMVLSRYDAGLL